ncbi:M1 family metallopeptidase [Kitasatospora viridis]|uniref:Aminopeptidase N n=1 Tax=Kitasatospora viridis TaxID=281105 RepID=A0A561UBX1_9ACTN|nr:M1 family metallopeptidase [Kitasatospora viridis]TWF96855.1 peptidase M1-like protein [Kitasatospora viridis]
MIAKAAPPALACWLLLAPLTPTAQAAPSPADPVFPGLGSTAYDALDYHLAFDYLADTRTVAGTAEITARTRQPLRELDLDALGLTVRQVTVDGRDAQFRTEEEKLTVHLPHRAAGGQRLTVKVEYTADPTARLPHTGWVPTATGFALAGQPNSAHTVFPCNDRPDDKARFTVDVTAPDGLLGVAGGTPAGSSRRDGRTTRTYRYRAPMATELLQVAVGDYRLNEHRGPDGLPLRDVVPPARLAAVRPALDLEYGQLEWIEQRLGPFPFESYGLLPVDTDAPDAFGFTGLETQTLTLYKPGFLTQPEPAIGSHMMHELVHSWFGDSVTPRSWSDLWLNEGHADYYGLLYRYQRGWPDGLGLTSLDDRMRAVYADGDQWRHDWGPVADPNAADLFEEQRYLGGVLVLYALRQRVGEQAFDRIERGFLARYRDGSASTADYVETASELAGQDLSGFLDAWLHGTRTPPMPGHPDWTVRPAGS